MGSGFVVVIPARYAAARLPGKPLLDVAGRPLVQHVYERALASGAGHVLIATDDERVAEAGRGFGARVCMTSPDHTLGTDRVAEAAARERLDAGVVVVNLQGDEPQMPPAVIRQVAELLADDPGAQMATLCRAITDAREVLDPAVVKVICDARGDALYFSRAPIPWDRDRMEGGAPDPGAVGYRRHVGLYAYRAAYLREFTTLAPAPCERAERLEQLRALYHGARIRVAEALEPVPAGVDVAADLERVRAQLRRADGCAADE